MGKLQIRRIAYACGAEVTGLDLREPLDAETIAEIRHAWLDHLLLLFPKQDLTRTQFSDFAAQLGEIEPVTINPKSSTEIRADAPNVGNFSNKTVNGKRLQVYKSGQFWHSDKAMTTVPASATLIYCKEIPPVGGDTMFANTYMAFDSLSPTMQKLVEGLEGIMDGSKIPKPRMNALGRQGEEAHKSASADRASAWKLTVQPAVRVHPETGRKALYLAGRAVRFAGMTEEESRPLIDFLNARSVEYEFTYRHRWAPDDLIMFDNRCMLHIALCDYDLVNDIRHLFHCSLVGEPSGYEYEPGKDETAVVPAAVAG